MNLIAIKSLCAYMVGIKHHYDRMTIVFFLNQSKFCCIYTD